MWYSTSAQRDKPSLPIKISILQQSVDLPSFRFLNYSIKPAATIGTEYRLGRGKNHDWHLSGDVGFYFHRQLRTAVFARAGIGYRRYFGRFNFSARVLAGSALVFATEPVYGFQDGTYTEVKNSGQLVFMPSADISLAYRLKQNELAPELFLSYQIAIDSPFSPAATLPHLFVGGGLLFYPFQ
ncbi:MAG: hypothetical protein AAF741_01330 [Bacteroidota bacterium]